MRGPKAADPINMYEVAGMNSGVEAAQSLFTKDEIDLYNNTLQSVRTIIEEVFDTSGVHFTGPTFITRIIGDDDDAVDDIKEGGVLHDQYWHPHVDKVNSEQYDYSGLVYLSSGGGVDFEGGEFHFLDGLDDDSTITGKSIVSAGSLMMFTSGKENPHRFTRGERGLNQLPPFIFEN